MVQKKSNSGKKKKNSNNNQVVKKQPSEEEKEIKKTMDKFSYYWLTVAILYFGCMIISWQMESGTVGWMITTIFSYSALVIWGILLFYAAKFSTKKQTMTSYRIVGACLVLMGMAEIIPFVMQII